MTQTRIPTELLLNITTYLTPKEKKEGLLICKEWYEVFRFGLYHTIHIEDLCQFKLLFSSLLLYPPTRDTYSQRTSIIPNGHVVRTLFINDRASIPYTRHLVEGLIMLPKVLFEQLPLLCPNLERLDFEPETWKFVHYHPNISKWRKSMVQLPTFATMGSLLPFIQCLGQGITTLSIQSEMIVDISTTQKLYCILSLAPNVRDLAIVGSKTATSLVLTVEDIEVIHTLLPCLESFSIQGDNITMAEPALKSIEENFPTAAFGIKKLQWNTISTPIGWLLYVAHKYPSVQDLTLAIRHRNNAGALPSNSLNNRILYERQAAMMRYLEPLVRNCSQLQKLSFSSADLSEWFHASFLDQLVTHCPRMTHLCPLVNKDNQIRYDAELSVALRVKHWITGLEIEQWRLDAVLPSTIRTLNNFTKLSHLELKCDSYHDAYDMDMVLDACPLLHSLVLVWGTLCTTTTNAAATTHPHPLRFLQLTFIAFYQHTFQDLTQRCRQLSTLHITRCKQLCEMKNTSTTTTVMKLHMPHNSFDTIVLDGVRLDYCSVASTMFSGPSSYMRVLRVNDKWYHHVAYTCRKSPLIRLLDKKDSDIVQGYFSKREQQCIFVNNSNHRLVETLSEQKLRSSLKTSLMFGFVEIKCKHVKYFVVDGNFASSSSSSLSSTAVAVAVANE